MSFSHGYSWPRSHRTSTMRRERALPSSPRRLEPLAVPRPLAHLEPLLLPTPAQFALQSKRRNNVAPVSSSKQRSTSPRASQEELLDQVAQQQQQELEQPLIMDESRDESAEETSPAASAPPDSDAPRTARAMRHSKTLSSLTSRESRQGRAAVRFRSASDRRNRTGLLKSNTMPNFLKLNMEPGGSRSRSHHRQPGSSRSTLSGLAAGGGNLRWSAPVWWEMPTRVGEIAEEYDSRQVIQARKDSNVPLAVSLPCKQ